MAAVIFSDWPFRSIRRSWRRAAMLVDLSQTGMWRLVVNSLQKKSIGYAKKLIDGAKTRIEKDGTAKTTDILDDLDEASDWLNNVLNMRGSKKKDDDDEED